MESQCRIWGGETQDSELVRREGMSYLLFGTLGFSSERHNCKRLTSTTPTFQQMVVLPKLAERSLMMSGEAWEGFMALSQW